MNNPIATSWMMVICLCVLAPLSVTGAGEGPDQEKLLVVWTSADRDVALKMVFLYTLNAKQKGWFDHVQLLVWGPSAQLLAEDKELQRWMDTMKQKGVALTACRACADSYGVSENLESLGVEVKYMGKPLSTMLIEGWKVITF